MKNNKKYPAKDTYITTEYIPIDQIQPSPNQPRKDLRVDENEQKNILLASIKEIGISSPLTVEKLGKTRYQVVQGNRRFYCAKLLGLSHVRCEIHEFSNEGQTKLVSFNIQNNRKPWAPAERAGEIQQIKRENKFQTNKELAEHLHCSENSVIVSLALQKKREEYQNLMNEYHLSEGCQVAFLRLEPKIRPIKNFSRPEILRIILQKVNQQTVKGATELRQLGSVFLRAHTHEEELYRFLKNPDSKVIELLYGTTRDGLVRDIEKLMDEVKGRLNTNDLSPKAKFALGQLKLILEKI